MANDNAAKLYKILDMLEKAGKDQKEISKIRKLIDYGKIEQALNKIRELNSSSGTKTETKQAKSQAKKATETENVIRFAEDENDATTEVVIENAETTTDKVFVNDSKLVVTDNAGEVKYESNEAADITVDGDEYVEPSEPTTPTTPEETPSTGDTTEEVTNPETSDSVLLIVAGLIISAAAGTFAMKQLKNHA